eukprot:scaffold1354_cov111-Isochrysis_galbana.AAC.7
MTSGCGWPRAAEHTPIMSLNPITPARVIICSFYRLLHVPAPPRPINPRLSARAPAVPRSAAGSVARIHSCLGHSCLSILLLLPLLLGLLQVLRRLVGSRLALGLLDSRLPILLAVLVLELVQPRHPSPDVTLTRLALLSLLPFLAVGLVAGGTLAATPARRCSHYPSLAASLAGPCASPQRGLVLFFAGLVLVSAANAQVGIQTIEPRIDERSAAPSPDLGDIPLDLEQRQLSKCPRDVHLRKDALGYGRVPGHVPALVSIPGSILGLPRPRAPLLPAGPRAFGRFARGARHGVVDCPLVGLAQQRVCDEPEELLQGGQVAYPVPAEKKDGVVAVLAQEGQRVRMVVLDRL